MNVGISGWSWNFIQSLKVAVLYDRCIGESMIVSYFYQVLALLGWAVALVCIMSVTYGSYGEYRDGGAPWSKGVNVLFDTVSRTVFGIGVAWIIYACVTGYGG